VQIFKVTDISSAYSLEVRPCAEELGDATVQPDGSWRFEKAGAALQDGAIRVVTNLASPWPSQATVSVSIAKPREMGGTTN